MSLWDKVKRFFGAAPPEPPAEDASPPKKKKKKKKKKKQPASAAPATTVAARPASPSAPTASPSAPAAVARPSTTAASAGPSAAPYRTVPVVPAQPKKGLPDPYEARDILGLSAEETRRRSLAIKPYQTAWIGRVDTIPPQSDERTALIDRGLILRGLLTETQIREIHRVGDMWIKHHEAHRFAEAAAHGTVEALLADERKKREETRATKKAAAARRREERAREILRRKTEDIVFLGRGVSAWLHDRQSRAEALVLSGIPILSTPLDVAKALGIEIGALRHLAYHAEAPEHPHYVYFEVAKRSGGKRLLASPHQRLRAAQSFIEKEILSKLELTPSAHGFVKGRSTVTNARPHLGQAFVVNLDLETFFPSITFPRIRGLFGSMGYSPAVATILALLTTEPPRVRAEISGKTYWVAAGERGLPQGASTSPLLSNLVARKLDRRLHGMATKLGFVYTRYADDLTFSGPVDSRSQAGYLIARVRHIVEEEGFTINEKKGRVQGRRSRQQVTGIVVNDKLGVSRDEVRRLRALLHQAQKSGLESCNRESLPHFRAHVLGRIAYVAMVDATKGAKLRAAFDALPQG